MSLSVSGGEATDESSDQKKRIRELEKEVQALRGDNEKQVCLPITDGIDRETDIEAGGPD